MLSCCSIHHKNNEDPRDIEYAKLVHAHKAQNSRITALALSMITLFLFAVSFVLFGLGTLSPTFLMGLGMFPYLGGAFLSFLGLGTLCGAIAFAALSAIRTCQAVN